MDYIWIIATLCAFFVKGLCGFANSLIFTSALSFSQSNINISPVELVLGYPSNLLQAWKGRANIKWKLCIPPSVLILLGNIPGILFLKNANVQGLKVFLGFVVAAIGIEMLLRDLSTKKWKESKILLAIIGILSGIICGLFGIGAPLGAYIGKTTDDTQSFKANIGVIFVVENTFRIVMYACMGIITLATVKQSVMLLPFMLLAMFAGMASSKFLSEKIVKKLVIVLLIVSGMALVLQNI